MVVTMERAAECACGRLSVKVRGDPHTVVSCHCDFCLKRTGSVYPVVAWFDNEQILDVSGDRKIFDGREIDGVGNDFDFSTIYHFCPVCGASVYWTFGSFPDSLPDHIVKLMERTTAIGVGSFVDPDFPPPTMQLRPALRPGWLTLHPAG